jgi:tetratricopeptide (TPR) repeat protein
VRLFLIALKNLADVYIEFDEYEKAKNWYFYYKFLSYNLEMLEDVLCAYECLGNAYKFQYQYHKAIKCYKKQIEVSWVLYNKMSELRAYDNIGIQYFYLGNKEKARYYHERMIYGRSENIKSELREKISKIFKEKNFQFFVDDKYIKNTKKNEELKEQLRFNIM